MEPLLQLRNITHVYPTGVIANNNVSLNIKRNTIHAIVGENGAGKTTLMKIIFGILTPQEGSIIFKGKFIKLHSPNDAINLGIGMVHQHLMLAPELTVAENIVLGVEPKKGKLFFDGDRAIKITREIAQEYGLSVPPEKKISALPMGIRQRVEILKALFRNAELLILDEPTSVLTPQETDMLFDTLHSLAKSGKTILFISHKLKEVKAIAENVTVMRDGRIIATKPAGELTENEIAYLMVGRNLNSRRIESRESIGDPLLSVRNVSYIDENGMEVLKNISFDVHGGEIVGLAGVEGNGQTELVKIITGLLTPTGGNIFVNSADVTHSSPRKRRERGIAHIPEDRMEDGVAANATLQENIIVDRYYKSGFSRFFQLLWKRITRHTNELIKSFSIRTQSPKSNISMLSGGNIQKVVVAREFSSNPDVIIAAQPTRGIDVGSAEYIHQLLIDLRDKNRAIFLVSADLDEILKLSSRILVIYNGEIVALFPDPSRITGKQLGPYMLGLKKQESLYQESLNGKAHS